MKPAPSHHIWDTFHRDLSRLKKVHQGGMGLTIRWTPGHVGIQGNEADAEAKRAAQEGSSKRRELPRYLHKALPHSKSAMKTCHHRKLAERAATMWKKSPQCKRLKDMGPSLPSRKYLELIETLPRKHAAILIQLRSGHAPLKKHLYRIGRSESPLCPACRQHPETVHHFLHMCTTYAGERREFYRAAKITSSRKHTILSSSKTLKHLFRYIARTRRFRAYGELPDLDKLQPS